MIKVLGVVVHSVLVDINHALAADLQQLFCTVQTRKMGYIGCKSFWNTTLCTLKDSIDLSVKGTNTVAFDDQTFVINTMLSP